jgi:RNA polymerase sigma factor (sigma-70 family)
MLIIRQSGAASDYMSGTGPRSEGLPHKAQFPATRWSLIVRSRQRPTADSCEALESLCSGYWYPLYAYARRQGEKVEDAQDLTQGFFARLLEKQFLKDFDRERGRFRVFLLAAFRHHISNERDRQRTQKHGGGQHPVPLNMNDAERRYHMEPPDRLTPEKIYERQWAMMLLDRALERLRLASRDSGQFDRLRAFLTGDPPGLSYSELACELGISEGALKVAVHRLRRRFRDFVREEIAETVAGPEEIEEEMRYLLAAVSL